MLAMAQIQVIIFVQHNLWSALGRINVAPNHQLIFNVCFKSDANFWTDEWPLALKLVALLKARSWSLAMTDMMTHCKTVAYYEHDIILTVDVFACHRITYPWMQLFAHSQTTLEELGVPYMPWWVQQISDLIFFVNISEEMVVGNIYHN